MSTLKVNNLQVGQDSTATNNLTWFQPGSPDGTIRLGSGNAGSATTKFTFDKDGNLTCVGNITANSIIAPIEGTLDDWIVHAGDTNTKFGFSANDTFQVQTGGSPRITATDSTVQLYSGTTKKLETYSGGVAISGDASSAILRFNDTDGNVNYQIAGYDGNRMVIMDGTGGTVLDLREDGNNIFCKNSLRFDVDNLELSLGGGTDFKIVHTGSENVFDASTSNPFVFKFAGNEKLRITSDGKIGIGEDDPDGNYLLIRAASTVGTTKGHIMLTGDSATVGQGPQIVFSESGGGSSYAGAYVGHIREGSNSTGSLVFATRATGGDANTVPTERFRIWSSGKVKIANHGTNNLRSLSVLAPKTQIQWGTAEDVGGFLMSENNGQFGLSGGGYWNGSSWVATHTGSAQIRHDGGGAMVFCTNTSLTSGNNFSPAEKLRINSSGDALLVTGTIRGDAYQSMRLGNTNTTSTSDHYWKIGQSTTNGSEAFSLDIITGCGYGAGSGTVVHTKCIVRATNATTLEGYWYSTSLAGAAGIKDIRWKYTGANNIYEIWVKGNQYANISPIVNIHGGLWTAFNTNTGSSSAPASSTAFQNGQHYTQIDGYNTIQYNQQNTTFLQDVKMNQGKGISFINAADTATGETVSSSVLDDYEEGQCTMQYSPASGSFAAHIYDTAKYVKIGRLVMVTGSISLNGAGNASGRVDITGWPYAPIGINSTWSLESGHGTIKGHYNYPDAFNMLVMNNGGTNAYIYDDAGNYMQVGSSGMGTGYNECQCSFTMTYYANA